MSRNCILQKNGEYFYLDKAVKIVKKGDYKVTFEVPIRIRENGNDTYIQKDFDELEIPEYFIKIDDELYLNFNKIFKITSFEDYSLLTSNTKKAIGQVFLNYNIKISNKNEMIEDLLKGESMKKWIKVGNTVYNLDNVTNIYFKDGRVIINFINSSTNKKNLVDIKPEYEIDNISYDDEERIKNVLESLGWIKVGNKYVNLDNVYNIKIFDDTKTMFINFISNISKEVRGQKIISTEFAKIEPKSEEEFEEIIKQLGI